MIRVGILGYGYWGPNLTRNFRSASGGELVAIAERDVQRRDQAARDYPDTQTFEGFDALLEHAEIDAVAIATPISTHFDLALQALRAGKHVLLEKPMATSVHEAETLGDEAARRGLTLMVDHTFVFTDAVQKIKDAVDNGSLGQLYYYDSVRVNLGLFQHDANVIWDLACHDVSIMDYVLPFEPTAVSAVGIGHVPGGPEDIAYLSVFFPNDFIAHIGVNWLAPVKVRRTLLAGSKKMVVYDDIEASEKVKIYDRGITIEPIDQPESLRKILIGYRTGDMLAPHIDRTEPLSEVVEEFLQAISSGKPTRSGAAAGLRVVRLLEAANESIRRRGEPVEIGGGGPS